MSHEFQSIMAALDLLGYPQSPYDASRCKCGHSVDEHTTEVEYSDGYVRECDLCSCGVYGGSINGK
jgi:hypothetical protein